MAIEQNTNEKRVTLSQVREDLQNGLTKWKKDDIGFGSLEKKYNLTMKEAIELFSHPKVKNIESKIPVFIIVDDIEEEKDEEEDDTQKWPVQLNASATIEVVQPVERVQQVVEKETTIVISKPKELVAFI